MTGALRPYFDKLKTGRAKLKFWVRGSLEDFGGDRGKKNFKKQFFSLVEQSSPI